jgi:hypothetical protein
VSACHNYALRRRYQPHLCLTARIVPPHHLSEQAIDAPAGRGMRVEQVMAYFLERDTEDGPFLRARLDVGRDGLLREEIFEVGEPVHLKPVYANTGSPEDQVWWIRRFSEGQGVSQVFITRGPHDVLSDYAAPVPALEKLPAMLRLALEAQ